MRKKHIKFISVLCATVLAFGLAYLPHFNSWADDDIYFSDVVNENFHCVTLSDYGIEDTDKTDETTDFNLTEDIDNVKSLHNIAFRAYTVFNNTTGSGTELHLFTQQGGKTGIALTIGSKNGKDLQLKRVKSPGPSISPTFTATASKAGINATTFNGTYFLLGLTVEFVDSDSDGDDDDMKLGVFFNDKLYDNSYITIRNAASSSSYKMGTRINYNGEAGEIYSYVEPKKISECPENDFDRLTLLDCGITDGSTEGKSGEFNIESLDKKLFNISAVFKGDQTSGTMLRLGATSATSGDGIGVYSKGSEDPNLYLSVGGNEKSLLLRKTNIATESSLDTKFDLYISTEKTDSKLKLGIFINNVLYGGDYFIFDNFASLGKFVVFEGKPGEAYSILPPITLEESDASDFTLISLSDLGIADGSGDAKGSYGSSFDKTVLGFNVKFSGDGTRLHYANNTSSYSGIGIRLDGKNLVVSCEAGSADEKLIFDSFTITPDDARTEFSTFANNLFLLHISCEFVDFGGDSNKKDVKIGIFINELLYKSEYLYIIDCADRMADNFNFNEPGTKEYSSIATAPKPFPEHLRKITLTDAGIGTGSGEVSGKFQTIDSLDGTVFGANLKFSKNSSRMHIGFKDSAYGGFGIRLEDGKIIVGNELGNKEGALSSIGVSAVKVDPVVLGVGETFVDKEFLLQISFEFVDRDKDGNNNDIKFGVFINGILCTNTYYYVMNQADLLGLGINFNEGGAASYAPYGEEFSSQIPDSLKRITLTDAGIGLSSGVTSGKFSTVKSLNGTVFSAKLKFKINGSRMHIGTKDNAYGGFGVRLENDMLIIGNEIGDKEGALSNIGVSFIKIDPKELGVGDTFVDKEFLLQMSFEFIDYDKDGDENDIKLGVFINGVLSTNMYYYVINQADLLGLGINFNEGGVASYAPYGEKSSSKIPDSLKQITLTDAGLGLSSGVTSGKFSTVKSLNGTVFSAKLKFNINGSRMHIGTKENAYGGFGVRLENDMLIIGNEIGDKEGALSSMPLSFIKIDPNAIGVGKTFVDKEFLLQMSFEFVDGAADRKADDIKLGVFINGKLFADTYFYLFGEANNLGLGINFNEGGVASYAPYGEKSSSKIPDSLKQITLSDARIGTGSGNVNGEFCARDSLNKTLFSAKLKFNINSSRMHIGTKTSDYSGFGVRLENDMLMIGNEIGDKEGALSSMGLSFIKIDPKKIGLGDTFVDKEFLLQISFEFVDRAGDGKADDIKLGVFINGKLFADTYFYLFGEAKNLGLGINFSEGGAASYESYGDVIPSGRKQYKELTPRDFMIADKEYKKVSVTSVYDYAALDGIAVTANVKFTDDSVDQCAFYCGKTWMGARVAVRADGKLQLSHLHKDGTQTIIARVDPKSVGIKSFLNTRFTLRLTFDTIKAEGGYIHYRLGAYVNGKPCNGGAYLVKYTEPITLQSAMFIYAGKSGSVWIDSEKDPVDFSVFGLQKSTWKKTLGIS